MKPLHSILRFFTQKKNRFLRISLTLLIIIGIYLIFDYLGPAKIRLKEDTAFGFSCQRAKELIVQEYDNEGNLWASRGMIIYKLEKGEKKFKKIAHAPTGINIFWLRNFTLLRKFTLRPECIEMVVTGTGDICTISAGYLWHLPKGKKRFSQTYELSHYGFGDQGVRNDGILSFSDSTVFFGEYFRNFEKKHVRILESNNNGKTWETSYTFQPGEIRHIHALQYDPYLKTHWVCTGDSDLESMLAWSDDEYRTIHSIGSDSQLWRVCQLVFTEKYVYWGTDNGKKEIAGIYSWNRNDSSITKLLKVDGAIFYGTRLKNGTLVFSCDREGFSNEIDDKTKLYLFSEGQDIRTIEAGTWKSKEEGFRFKFAKLRFQRNQNASFLAITCLNQHEFPDGELILIAEDELIKKLNEK